MERIKGGLVEEKNQETGKDYAPTGNPNLPFTMEEAKAIRVMVSEWIDGATGSEEEEVAVKEDNEEEDKILEQGGVQEMKEKLVMQGLQIKVILLGFLMKQVNLPLSFFIFHIFAFCIFIECYTNHKC